ncbi:MAG: hypothetical protein EOP01_02100 [Propionibacteriaceae bacterium]|nr:MAG: hypothetical protein EOP01_02100 [Propionibacteriaceae bacterium]
MSLEYTPAIAVETPEDVIARILAGMIAGMPGWTPVESAPEVVLGEEVGRAIADTRYQAYVAEPARAMQEFGTSVAALAAVPGTAATIPIRIDLVDPGTTAPAQLLMVGTTVDGVEVTFTTGDALTAAAGATSLTTTATATDVGDLGNGVPAGPLVLVSSTATVLGVTATGASVNGADDESAEDYLDRLVQAQSLTHRGFVLAPDAAIQARTVPGVHRARAVDNYDSDTGTAGVERTISVYAVDVAGNAVTGTVRSTLLAYLDGLRETNFVVRVGTPTYTPVQVTFSGKAKAGRDPAVVQAAVLAKAYSILDPGTWAGGADTPPEWRDERVVRYLDLAGQLDAVDGVDYLSSLTLNGGSVDVLLPGVVALPASRTAASPTTVTGTVSPA